MFKVDLRFEIYGGSETARNNFFFLPCKKVYLTVLIIIQKIIIQKMGITSYKRLTRKLRVFLAKYTVATLMTLVTS